MIKYNLEISSTDAEGISFLKSLIYYSSLGAKVIDKAPLRNRFPHKALMYLETEVIVEHMPGTKVTRLDAPYTKAELEEMDWSEFKDLLKSHDITGRSRHAMIHQYLSLFN